MVAVRQRVRVGVMAWWRLCLLLAITVAWTGGARADVGAFVLSTYNSPPRQSDGRVDVELLGRQLEALQATTYNWLIWHRETDFEDLKRFLPLAQKAGLKVWVTVVPPSESPPVSKHFSEPYRLDFLQWAGELSALSARFPVLEAWSIDDFSENEKFFSEDYMRGMISAQNAVQSGIRFIPCIYYARRIEYFGGKYKAHIDGILFPYMSASGKKGLTDVALLGGEIAQMRKAFGADMPLYVDVYMAGHSQLGKPVQSYVQEVAAATRAAGAQGLQIYTHPHGEGDLQFVAGLFQSLRAADDTAEER